MFLRIKPISDQDLRAIGKVDDSTIEVYTQSRSGMAKEKYEMKGDRYYFDHIFDERTDQETVFMKTAYPLVKAFFDGVNCLFLAYGVTNAGKTYTIFGEPRNHGIVPRTLSTSFLFLRNKQELGDFCLKVSYVEVYNDNVYDLLATDQKGMKEKLQVVEQNGAVHVKGMLDLGSDYQYDSAKNYGYLGN